MFPSFASTQLRSSQLSIPEAVSDKCFFPLGLTKTTSKNRLINRPDELLQSDIQCMTFGVKSTTSLA